jgi:hypothetical protein
MTDQTTELPTDTPREYIPQHWPVVPVEWNRLSSAEQQWHALCGRDRAFIESLSWEDYQRHWRPPILSGGEPCGGPADCPCGGDRRSMQPLPPGTS